MDDQPEKAHSYPVKVVFVKMYWIVNETRGKEFLDSILKLDNLEIYNNESLQIIIEYLFSKFRGVIYLLILPLYLINFACYYLFMNSIENFFEAPLEQHSGNRVYF